MFFDKENISNRTLHPKRSASDASIMRYLKHTNSEDKYISDLGRVSILRNQGHRRADSLGSRGSTVSCIDIGSSKPKHLRCVRESVSL